MTDAVASAPADSAGADDPAAVADRVAAAATGVSGVVGLDGGPFGEAATYLPGRRVAGVRVLADDDTVEVHVVLDVAAPLLDTADRVRDAVSAVTGGRVDVVVEDVAEADEVTHDPNPDAGADTGAARDAR